MTADASLLSNPSLAPASHNHKTRLARAKIFLVLGLWRRVRERSVWEYGLVVLFGREEHSEPNQEPPSHIPEAPTKRRVIKGPRVKSQHETHTATKRDLINRGFVFGCCGFRVVLSYPLPSSTIIFWILSV